MTTNSQITLIEFEKLYQKQIGDKNFKELENFILANSDENAPFLKLGSDCNGKFIQARNYVGVLQIKNGFMLEILPKITENSDNKSKKYSKEILIKMLKSLKNFPFKNSNLAHLNTDKSPLFEIFITMFLDELSFVLKKGIKRNYVKLSDNLNFLKGKLIINEQIKRNIIHKERFYVEYDEFLMNIEINQIIKTTLEFLYKKSTSFKNCQRIREFLFIFDGISKHNDCKNFFKNYKINPQIRHYKQIYLWCKVFLLGNSFIALKGSSLAFAILFDMNKLFEKYVGEFIAKIYPNAKLQYAKKYLIDEPKSFILRPDILIEFDKIFDTKWKILTSKDDITQADLYQIYAYSKKYECNELFLIYPKILGVQQEYISKFWYDKNTSLKILYFDLQRDEIT